ncbi:FAD-binding oxidoreductase [Novosphingobium sp. MMS21-SN21R]|uniref:FAD-binding oxidoreductase n=1 Tax=Novosphingobium sp. MMS21-SN21R TaxID=2969298 RepID=UPI0028850A7A|nr:FAD-binding oxidoreductase [Novosphingobium sp. MMS21-SN21R]MDT0510253.1 FAD-binding oxidoreductase [Novosphingobium sp. MMS21-SN21R]
MKTPPGISPSVFANALTEFVAVVGKEWVFSSDEDVALYRDAYSPLQGTDEDRWASAAVAPASAEEVQAIVKIANRRQIPLYAISTGKNLGYGGSAPNYSGSVVVDLKRMNRIIEVNESNCFAIVEPGVSYFDLYNYIQERKLNVWLDVPDPGWGSLVGNALDHGVGHTASRFRNHFDAHCGMEVVLANGEMLRTGMGAMPNSKTWAQYKMGFGPILDGLFSQSNMGIVTKMGFWLMPKPEAFMHAVVMAPRYDDLHPLVETLKYVENLSIAPGPPELGSPLLGAGGETKSLVDMFYNGPPKMDKQQMDLVAVSKLGFSSALQQYGLDNGIPYWSLNLTFYGPAKVIAAQWEAVQDIANAAIKGAKFSNGAILTDAQDAASKQLIYPQNVGVPNLEFFAFGSRAGGNPQPANGHMWFSPVIPQTAEGIFEANRVFDEATRTIPLLQNLPMFNLRPFSLPSPFHERAFLFILGFPILDDPAVNKSIISAFRELIRIGAEHGWGEYRTPSIFQDQVMGTYSFNDNMLRRVNETIKDALDPNGILSPGRYGIWPKGMRGAAK